MRRWNLPLTYQPKIEPVRKGECTQTIRVCMPGKPKKQVGDLIRFYVWSGKPYRSKRETITGYMVLVTVKNCRITLAGIDYLTFLGETRFWYWDELDALAALDGIVPATGEALRDVLIEKNPIPEGGTEAQILRWDPAGVRA